MDLWRVKEINLGNFSPKCNTFRMIIIGDRLKWDLEKRRSTWFNIGVFLIPKQATCTQGILEVGSLVAVQSEHVFKNVTMKDSMSSKQIAILESSLNQTPRSHILLKIATLQSESLIDTHQGKSKSPQRDNKKIVTIWKEESSMDDGQEIQKKQEIK